MQMLDDAGCKAAIETFFWLPRRARDYLLHAATPAERKVLVVFTMKLVVPLGLLGLLILVL